MTGLAQNSADPEGALPFQNPEWTPLPAAIKRSPADFRVEEIPLYETTDEGTHVFFAVEKTGLSTSRAVDRIARALGVRPRAISYAGQKDADAVTRQVFSIEHVDLDRILSLECPQIDILWARRHPNKLRLGHLRANRFVLRLRDADVDSLEEYRARLVALSETGAPNYFGSQRFGSRGHTAQLGRALLREDWSEMIALLLGRPTDADTGPVRDARLLFEDGKLERAAETWPHSHRDEKTAAEVFARSSDERKACLCVSPRARQFYVDALQSDLFNRVLSGRIESPGRMLGGDVAYLHRNGACFAVEDVSAEQRRSDAGEISPSGPLFGGKMRAATGKAGELECAVLKEAGLSADLFAGPHAGKRRGARRPLRFFPEDPGATAGTDDDGPYVELTFTLPPGCYATVLLRELCHREVG